MPGHGYLDIARCEYCSPSVRRALWLDPIQFNPSFFRPREKFFQLCHCECFVVISLLKILSRETGEVSGLLRIFSSDRV